MSIRDEIRSRREEGRLFLIHPTAAGTSIRRVVLVTKDLRDALCGPWPNASDEIRFKRLKAYLDQFISGARIGPTYLKPLKGNGDGVWNIRNRTPRPSIRIFGFFAERDVFIATHFEYRKPLGGFNSIEWNRAIRSARAKWRQYFHPYPPHTGTRIRDYVSNAAKAEWFR